MSRIQHPPVYCLELLPKIANTVATPRSLRRTLAVSCDAGRPAAALVRARWLQVAVRLLCSLLDVAAGEAEAAEQKTAVTSR